MDVVIIGGGIGGLTAALALHRAGIKSRVFEATSEYKPAGIGINLHAHAVRELAKVGLEPALCAGGIAAKEFSFFTQHGQLVHTDACGRFAARRACPYRDPSREAPGHPEGRGDRAARSRRDRDGPPLHRHRRRWRLGNVRRLGCASHGSRRRLDRLRRIQFGGADVAASRRAAVDRRAADRVARHRAGQAVPVRCDHHPDGPVRHRDGDGLSGAELFRRHPASEPHRDHAVAGRAGRAGARRRRRRIHRPLRRLAIRLDRHSRAVRRSEPQAPSDARARAGGSLDASAARPCSATPRTR